MSDKTAIEWTDATWNPIRGCSRVSQGCVHCYAESVARRFSGPGQPYEGLIDARTGGWNGKVKFIPGALDQPLRWKRPRRIFVNSMSDLFHESIPDDQIDRIFAVMALAPQHTFQVLTKRPERMAAYLLADRRDEMNSYAGMMMSYDEMPQADWPLPNVWLGVSVENQTTADERIPLLLRTPAAVRFLSCEPLLGPIDFTKVPGFNRVNLSLYNWWVIVGGESGHGARPMHPDWPRKLRDQCSAAGVAFFFKQWGEWVPYDDMKQRYMKGELECAGTWRSGSAAVDGQFVTNEDPEWHASIRDPAFTPLIKCGKKLAGRRLDGREHSEYPR